MMRTPGLATGACPLSAQTLQENLKLVAPDGAAGDLFGNAVSISGTTAVVGSLGDDDGGADSGSAHVFDTTTGQQLFKLTASDGAAGDAFGVAVSVSGTTAIVGSPFDDGDLGERSRQGRCDRRLFPELPRQGFKKFHQRRKNHPHRRSSTIQEIFGRFPVYRCP